MAALERAEEALAEAETLLERLATTPTPTRGCWSRRRSGCSRCAPPRASMASRWWNCRSCWPRSRCGWRRWNRGGRVGALEDAAARATEDYRGGGRALRVRASAAAAKLERAAAKELPPLRLDKARFAVAVTPLEEPAWGPAVPIWSLPDRHQPRPGARPARPHRLGRRAVAAMLALKVVLSAGSSVPTLVFDEVDSGIGGATAAAVGERLARVAERVQVLVVTH